jgi:hypothetical protein
VDQAGSHPTDYGRPWGGLNVQTGAGCKYINLVIHDNAQGVSFWSGATDSELYGCLIYNNGWEAPDRGHGHGVYTQNKDGIKTIADCILSGGHGYSMHAYGSSRAYVDNYLMAGNIAYAGGPFLIGGGRPSRGIRVFDNALYGVSMRLGYGGTDNEDCDVEGNLIVNGTLSINKFKQVNERNNETIPEGAPRPQNSDPKVIFRVNRYEPSRAHLAIFNWSRKPTVEVDVKNFLKRDDRFVLRDPKDFFGKPIFEGVCTGSRISVPVTGEFMAAVVVRITGQ